MMTAQEIYTIWRNKSNGTIAELFKLIDDAITEAYNEGLNDAANTAVRWSDGLERGDYDAFSASSAIAYTIREMRKGKNGGEDDEGTTR